jgi:hypothetical protein
MIVTEKRRREKNMTYTKKEALIALNELQNKIPTAEFELIRDGLTEIDLLKDRDSELEELWNQFEDVPVNPETECIEEPFLGWGEGISREEIWHWFDQRYSKGVAALLYAGEGAKDKEAYELYRLRQSCDECTSMDCAYNNDGTCRFAMVFDRQPNITESDGCTEFQVKDYLPTYASAGACQDSKEGQHSKWIRWISVEEALPNVDESGGWELTVIAADDQGIVKALTYEKAYVRKKYVYRWKYKWGTIYDGNPIVAWMPLPEPPAANDQGKQTDVIFKKSPLLIFIEQEVPFRLREILNVPEKFLTAEVIETCVKKLYTSNDIMFAYDGIDEFLTNTLEELGINNSLTK